MAYRPKYAATVDEHRIWFIDPRNGDEHGYVDVDQRPYPVRLPDGEFVGAANKLCDALPLILEHHEKEYLERRRREFAREKEAARSCRPFATVE